VLRRACTVGLVTFVAASSWVLATPTPIASSSFPGANGKIVFQRDGEIFVMDPDGSDDTRLTTDPAADFEPSWSADGKEIVFASTRTGNGDIYVMDADGSDPRRLTTNDATQRGPSFSPDGEHIAYTSNESPDGADDIFVMDDDGGDQRNVSNIAAPMFAIEPSWSPDGEHIAFSLFTGSDFEIYVMRADGSDQTNLTNNGALDSEANWSPDGEHIAFTRFESIRAGSNEIFVMDDDGGDQRNLTNFPGEDARAAWSPDGDSIAFVRSSESSAGIFVMGADGSDPTPVTTEPDDDPDWQPLALEGDVTVTKAVVGTPPPGTTFTVEIDCDGDQDDKALTFGEAGGTKTIEREGFGPLECEVAETQTGGAATIEVACSAVENAECGDEPGSFELFEDDDGDDTRIAITVTNTFPAPAPVVVEPTFTG
jgi:TolB protein